MKSFTVITVPGDGLVLLEIGKSAGILMVIYKQMVGTISVGRCLAPEGLIITEFHPWHLQSDPDLYQAVAYITMETRIICRIRSSWVVITASWINPLRARFFRGNINIYLHLVSFVHIDITQVIEILPQIRQWPTYTTYSISWLLMSWPRKEPGHQQPLYWPT